MITRGTIHDLAEPVQNQERTGYLLGQLNAKTVVTLKTNFQWQRNC